MKTTAGRHSQWKEYLRACAIVILTAYILLSGVLGLIVTMGENDHTGQRWGSCTISEARWNGTFVTKLEPNPSDIDWHGQPISINEVWVERQSQRIYTIVVVPGVLHIPINRLLPGSSIGMNLKQGRDCFIGEYAAFFVRDDKGGGFGSVWPAGFFYEHLPDYDFTPINVKLVEGWHSGDRVDIVLTPKR